MFQRKPRRFRRRSNGRNNLPRGNGDHQGRIRTNLFLPNQTRGNFRTTQSAEKLFEKYNTLAKEALTSGDKTLGENYLQHADHFSRIIKDKNKNKEHSNPNIVTKSIEQKIGFFTGLVDQNLGVLEGRCHQRWIAMLLEDLLDRLQHSILLQHLPGQVIAEPFQALHLHRSSVLHRPTIGRGRQSRKGKRSSEQIEFLADLREDHGSVRGVGG